MVSWSILLHFTKNRNRTRCQNCTFAEESNLENWHVYREVVRPILCGENKFRQPSSSQEPRILEASWAASSYYSAADSSGHESQPTKRDVQTPLPEQKQMSTLSPLPAVKKTRTRVVKSPSRFKDCCLVSFQLQKLKEKGIWTSTDFYWSFCKDIAPFDSYYYYFFFVSFVTFIFYYFSFFFTFGFVRLWNFVIFHKLVHFKGREMLRYCIIVVGKVTCYCCFMWSIFGH